MPTSVACPGCKRLLKLPEAVLGQLVQCPSCSHTFTAREDPPPSRINEHGEVVRPQSQPDRDRYEGTPRRDRYDDDYPPRDGSRYRDDEDYPDRGGRSAVRGDVSGPANALMTVGVLGIILSALALVVNLANGGGADAFGGPPGGEEEQFFALMQGPCWTLIGMAWGILITVGASRMKNLKSYGLAMTAGIVAMLPCHGCCLLGLPFGIWALVVLARPEVREAFT